MKNKKTLSLSFEKKQKIAGYLFVLPIILGALVLFMPNLIKTIVFSFNEINLSGDGYTLGWKGFDYYYKVLFVNADFIQYVIRSFGEMLVYVPTIIIFSLFMASVLNQKFKGRVIARAIFFLPVIIASSYVMVHMAGPHINAPLFTVSSGDTNTYGGLIDFEGILSGLNLPTQVNDMLSDLLGNVFGLIWSCGVQTILFLSGLQSIQVSLYEVSKIEGANKWEEFWFITVPMLRHVMTLVIVYTMIELFTAVDSPVMNQAYTLMQEKQIYDRSSAMLWLYFLIVCAVIGLILFIYNRYCLRKWE